MDIGHVLSLVLFPCDTSASLNSFNSFSITGATVSFNLFACARAV